MPTDKSSPTCALEMARHENRGLTGHPGLQPNASGRPKLAKALPAQLAKALPRTAVEELLDTVVQDGNSKRQTDWAERDLALVGGVDRRAVVTFSGLALGPRGGYACR